MSVHTHAHTYTDKHTHTYTHTHTHTHTHNYFLPCYTSNYKKAYLQMLHGRGKVYVRFDELENARDTWDDYDCRCKLVQANCTQSSCHPFFTLQFFK